MTKEEKAIIVSKAKELINLLSECDEGLFIDSIVYAIIGNNETLLDFI
jgi:hypothetical protein